MDANIQKYQAFVEVADAGSFTKAAETLAYSQSGISHMVSDLERDWGVALFERSRRGVVLTGDGARLLPEARALCESFRALEATVDEVRGLRPVSSASVCSRAWPPIGSRASSSASTPTTRASTTSCG